METAFLPIDNGDDAEGAPEAESSDPADGTDASETGEGAVGTSERGTEQPLPERVNPPRSTTGMSDMIGMLAMWGFVIFIFYWMMIRPQKRRERERKMQVEALKKNDRVVSIGGIHGTVVAVGKETLTVKIDDNKDVRMKFSRSAIAHVEPRGSDRKEDEA